MESIKNFIVFFTHKLRLSKPWNFKVPFLIAIPYLVFLINENSTPVFSLKYIFVSLIIIIGIAGIGYLTNDLGDKQKDNVIGKNNATNKLNSSNVILLFTVFFSFIILPWVVLPFNYISVILLVTEILLFFLYAFPPFRLKEKNVLGVFCDALYAHVLPAILASYTFYLIQPFAFNTYLFFVLMLSLWQFVLGVRNIIFHQLHDYDNDVASQTKTFVINYGFIKSEKLITKLLLPLEFLLFVVFLSTCGTHYYWLLLTTFIFWLFNYTTNKQNIKLFNYREFAYKFLDDWYIKWLPLLIIFILCFKDLQFVFVFILHFIVFQSELKSRLFNLLKL